MPRMATRPVILYVENDPDDDFLLRRALKDAGIDVILHLVGSVKAARAYLTGVAPYGDREKFPLPDLLITDMSHDVEGSGLELVRWIRSEPELRHMKILCSTGNDDPEHRKAFELLNVHCYTKSHNMRALVEAIREELAAN